MSSCNMCSYKADYIKDESNNIADVLCGACLDMVEQKAVKAIDIVYIDRESGYKDFPYRAFYKGVYVDDFMTAPSYKEVVATYGQVHYQVVCSFCNSVEEVPEGSTVVCFNCNNELTDTGEEL